MGRFPSLSLLTMKIEHWMTRLLGGWEEARTRRPVEVVVAWWSPLLLLLLSFINSPDSLRAEMCVVYKTEGD